MNMVCNIEVIVFAVCLDTFYDFTGNAFLLKFFRDFSLYAEPMLSYYFDNGSQISTIYQEKPFNYGFNIGLRFNINR